MKIRQVEKEIINRLLSVGIEQNEARIEAEMLIKHAFGFSGKDFILKDAEELDAALVQKVLESAELRAMTRKPIQQIIGHAHFMGEKFIVNEHVLIPRDETEILVRQALLAASLLIAGESKRINVLDIGTGSSCIACLMAKSIRAKVLGVDISSDALDVAVQNSKNLGILENIEFRKSDLFSEIKKEEKFDIIISNPPYIPKNQRENLEAELKYEPENALFTDDFDGIEFYDKIVKQSPTFLNKDGYLMFELGIGQADLVQSLMKDAGFKDIIIKKDLAEIERVISGRI